MPHRSHPWIIEFHLYIFLCIPRVTFLVAESCLIAGATKNAYHTKYRGMIYAQNFSCEALRKGVFVAGAVFVVVTMILNVYYYMYFTKATTTPVSHKANRVSSTVGMAGYAWWTMAERVTHWVLISVDISMIVTSKTVIFSLVFLRCL